MILQDKLSAIALFIALSTALPALSQSYDERLKSIQSQVRDKQHALSASSDELDKLQQQLGQSASNLSTAKRNLERSVANLSALQSKLAELNKQANNLSQQHSAELSLLAVALISMQHDMRTHRFGYLLSADDWSSFERRAVYYSYFGRQREKKLSQLAKQLSQLSDIRVALVEQNRLLELEHQRHHKIVQKINYERQNKQQIINALEKKIAHQQVALISLEKDATELRRIIEQLGTSVTSPLQFNILKGKLPWPLDKPIKAQSGHGKLPGIFLAADADTEVKSIHDGLVVFSDWFRSYGMLLIIDHGDGYMSLYANNEVLYKDIGDVVQVGERIAEVGSGGTSNDSGLYFEIRRFNKQLDPRLWCRGANI